MTTTLGAYFSAEPPSLIQLHSITVIRDQCLPLCSLYEELVGFHDVSSSLGWTNQETSDTLHTFIIFIASLPLVANSFMSFLYRALKTVLKSRLHQRRAEQDNPFLHLKCSASTKLTTLSAGREGCWLNFNLLLNRSLRSFSKGLLSNLLFLSLHMYPALPHPRGRIQHLFLLNFMHLVIVLLSTFSLSLCSLFLLLKESTVPLSLLLSVKLFSAYTISNSGFKTAAGIKAYSKLLLIIVKINIKSLEYSYIFCNIFQKILHFYGKVWFSPFLLCVMFYLVTFLLIVQKRLSRAA